MATTGMELGDLYRGSVTTWTGRVADLGSDAWDAPTPCTDWSVKELLNHVVGEDRWTVPLVRGASLAEVGDALDGDLLGGDPTIAVTQSAAAALAVVREHLPTGGSVQLSYGEEDLAEYVRQLAADHLLHAWDLAVATGGDRRLDPALVAAVADWFADREDAYRRAGAIGPRVDAGGDPQSDLLAAAGRDPSWTPPSP